MSSIIKSCHVAAKEEEMKPLLEDLWESYQSQKNENISEEERTILQVVNEWEDKLYAGLNEEQKELLEKRNEVFNDLVRLNMKNSFVDGVLFGTKYFMETIYEA